MTRFAILALVLAQGEAVKPRYAAERGDKDRIYMEVKLGIKIEGAEQLAGFVRSAHPFLSMEKLVLRAEGSQQVTGKNRRKIEYDEARAEVRYDDEDREFDFQKGQPAPGDKDKLRQMMWFLAAGGRNFTLSGDGEYKSDDPNQDQNGEAMDLITLGITRMPDAAVKAGDVYEKTFKGQRSEKGKSAKYDFRQKVTVEKVEEKDGKKVATLSGDLTGKVDGAKDPSAEEGWTKCEGKTKLLIEVESGRVLSSEGKGQVMVYFRNTADTGAKQELKLTFNVEGRLSTK